MADWGQNKNKNNIIKKQIVLFSSLMHCNNYSVINIVIKTNKKGKLMSSILLNASSLSDIQDSLFPCWVQNLAIFLFLHVSDESKQKSPQNMLKNVSLVGLLILTTPKLFFSVTWKKHSLKTVMDGQMPSRSQSYPC